VRREGVGVEANEWVGGFGLGERVGEREEAGEVSLVGEEGGPDCESLLVLPLQAEE